jgi:hypothetical protein
MTSDVGADEPLTLAALMPTPARRRFPWKIAAAVGAVAAVFTAVGVVAYVTRPGPTYARSLGPLRADAARECKAAIGAEARSRADAASRTGGRSATVVLGGVDVEEPRWGVVRHAWTVDGAIKFTIVSVLGTVPGSVDVRCTAARSAGGSMATSVANR